LGVLTQAPAGYELSDVADLKDEAQALLARAHGSSDASDHAELASQLVDLVLAAVRPDVEDLLEKQREVSAALIHERRITFTSTLGYADGWNDALTLAESLITGRDIPMAA